MKVLVFLSILAVAFADEDFDKKACLEEPDEGMCRGYFPMYYYDAKTQSCKEFIYGGCLGNDNRHDSEDECLERCSGVVVWNSNTVCELEKVVGPCRAAFPRYFYNKATGQCEQFIYGGCQGNGNNFSTRDECHDICKT